jgi:uncharacterized membrane protein
MQSPAAVSVSHKLHHWRYWGVAIVAGLVAAMATHFHHGWPVSGVAGWVATLVVLLAQVWHVILRSTAEQTRRRAEIDDPGKIAVFAITILASVASLAVAVRILRDPDVFTTPGRVNLLIALGIVAVVGAWLLVHTAFTLHYAHLYYRDGGAPGGLEFPGNEPPDDLDFAYFSLVIGMTFQTADVSISGRDLRRTALWHGLLAFIFNTAVLALAVSLIFGRLE